MKKEHYLLLALLIAVFFTFSSVLQNQFVNWDDEVYLTKNELVKKAPFSNLGELLTHKINSFAVPLTLLSFQIEHYFFGLNPKPYHVNNLILHLLNVLLVYFFVKRLIGESLAPTPTIVSQTTVSSKQKSTAKKKKESANENQAITTRSDINYLPFLVALLFGVHPMNVESVAWVTERKDLLYSFFTLLSLIFYTHSAYSPTINEAQAKSNSKQAIRNYVFCILFFILSLLSKPQAIFLPFVLLLIDYFKNQTAPLTQVFSVKNQLYKIPFFIISLLAGIYLLTNVGTKVSEDIPYYGILDKLLLSFYQVGLYLGKLFFPFYLNNFYPYPVKSVGFYPILFYVVPLILAGLIALIVWKFRRNKVVLFGVLFYAANILIFLQIFSVNTAIAYERFNYLAYIGLFLIGVSYLQKYANIYLRVLFVAYVLMCCVLSFQRSRVWTNDVTLFADMAEKNPNDRQAKKIALKNMGDAQMAKEQYSDAINTYSQSISIDGRYEQAFLGRAFAYLKMKQYTSAIQDYNYILSLNTTNPVKEQAFYNRGTCFLDLQNLLQAQQDFSAVIKLNPYSVPSYLNRAYCYVTLKQYEEASKDYQIVLQIDRNNATAMQQLQALQRFKK